jgi:hypothetical protein
VWGEALEVTTWPTPLPHGLELLQHLGAPPRVRARTRWEWRTIGGDAVAAPDDLAHAFATPVTA